MARLAHWSARGRLLINPTVFAEWCPDFATFEQAEAAVGEFGLLWQEIPKGALFLASRAHLQYRRRGGTRAMVLPDFLTGAPAAVARIPILTRDRQRFDSCFNGLKIVAPDAHRVANP